MMKKRIISMLLAITMIVTMVPVVTTRASAVSAGDLDFTSAAEAGLDVFTAWFNTANHDVDDLTSYDAYVVAVRDRDETPFAVLIDAIIENEEYHDLLNAWKLLTFDEDSLTDIATDKEKALYVTLLHDMLMGEDASMSVNNIVNEAGDVVSTTMKAAGTEIAEDFFKQLFEDKVLAPYMNDTSDYDEMIELLQGQTDTNVVSMIENSIFEYLENKTTTATFLEQEVMGFLGDIPDLFALGKTVADTIQRTAEVYALIGLEESYYNVVEQMVRGDDATDKVKAAAKEIADLRYTYQQDPDMIKKYIAAEISADTLVEGVSERAFDLLRTNPLMKGIEIGQVAGKFFCSLLFDTEDQNAIAYTLLALKDIEDALYESAEYYWLEFVINPTEVNAKNFNAAMRLIYRFTIAANKYALDYVETIYHGGLVGIIGSAVTKMMGVDNFSTWTSAITRNIKLNQCNLYVYDNTAKNFYEDYSQKFLVAYDANGGVGAPASQVKNYGVDITMSLVEPTRTGYKFKGWLAEFSNYSVVLYPGYTYSYDESVTLVAQWEQQTYGIMFHANGGTGAPGSVLKFGGVPLTLPTQEPVRSGYTFEGWANLSNATVAEYSAGGVLYADGARNLYAVWKPVGAFEMPTSYETAMDIVDYSSTVIGTTPGRIRYMAQVTSDSYFVDQYWYYSVEGGSSGMLSPGDKCTRCALSMALSFFGLDYTPGSMSSMYGAADIPSPIVDIPNMLTMIERVNSSDFDLLWNNYAADTCFSPIVLYFSYLHPNDGTIHDHAVLVIGRNGNTYYAVDSAANQTHVIELTFNADKTAIATCSYSRYADTSSIKSACQWKLSGEVERSAYTITYDWSDNVVTRTYGTKEHGVDAVISEDIPTYGPYVFAGWALGDNLKKVVYQPGDLYTQDADLYLYAVWQDTRHYITGVVRDATVNGANYGEPIEGVTVEFFDAEGVSVGTATTDSEGVYGFAFSQYGTYSQAFTKNGYGSMTVDSLIVNANTPSMGIVVLVENDEEEEPQRNIIAEGTCGENLVWELDDVGLLTVSGSGAMSGYTATTIPWYEYKEQIASIVIGDEVTSIGAYAFINCDNVSDVYLGRSVTSINSYAFQNNEKLTTITVPDNLTSVVGRLSNYFPFRNTSVTTIIVPKTAVALSEQLYNMDTVTGFEAEGDNGYGYFDVDGILYYRDIQTGTQTLVKCPQSKVLTGTYTVLEGTHEIGSYAFCNKDRLENVSLPEELTDVGAYAFYDCDLLEMVRIPDAVTSIGTYAFTGCDNVSDVYLGRSVTSIGSYAFQNCANLTTITVPDNLTSVVGRLSDYFPFRNTSVTTIIVPKTAVALSEQLYNMDTVAVIEAEGDNGYRYFEEDGILYYKDPQSNRQTLVKCPQSKVLIGTYTVLEGTHEIGAYAFYNKDRLENVVLPESLTTVGNYAFHDCDLLETVHIPDAVTSIGHYAFNGCDSIDNVYMGRAVKTVSYNAFASCGKLTTITIPDATSVYEAPGDTEYSFYNSPVTTVIVPKTVTSIPFNLYNMSTIAAFEAEGDNGYGYFDEEGILYYKNVQTDKQTLVKCPQSKVLTGTYTVLEGTHEIGMYAFYDKDRLENVVLPDSLTTIGLHAFQESDLLETVRIPDAVTSISSYTFNGCDGLVSVYLGKSLKSISNSGFENCSALTNAYFYGAAPAMGSYVFRYAASEFAIYYLETQTGWTTPTWGGYPAYPFAAGGTAGEYQINSISLKAADGTELVSIPKAAFQATVSVTNRSVEHGDTVVLLAAYTANGQFRGLMSIAVEDCPVGATVKVTLPVENTSGDIAELRAFTVTASGEMIPLGDAVVFPA